MKVGLVIPCYIDTFYPEVGIATLELLERLGVEVEYPFEQPAVANRWRLQAARKTVARPKNTS